MRIYIWQKSMSWLSHNTPGVARHCVLNNNPVSQIVANTWYRTIVSKLAPVMNSWTENVL